MEVVRWLKALLSIIGESSDDSNQAGGQQAAGLLLLVLKTQLGWFFMTPEHPAWRVILIDPEER